MTHCIILKRRTRTRRKRAETSREIARRDRAERLTSNRMMQIPYGYPSGLPEMKFVDTDFSSAEITTTGVISCVNAVQLGTSVNTRVGVDYLMRSVEIQGVLRAKSAGAGDTVALALVYDRQPNAALPSDWQTIWDRDHSETLMRNHSNRRRFKVLWKGRHAIAPVGDTGQRVIIDFYRPLKHPVSCNAGNAGTIADINAGALYFMYIGEQATGTTATEFDGQVRVRYTDK